MKRASSVTDNHRSSRRKLIYVKSVSEIPDFRSDDEIAAWYQTHSTVLILDQLEALPAKRVAICARGWLHPAAKFPAHPNVAVIHPLHYERCFRCRGWKCPHRG